ncbi:sulfotransferase family protein [Nitzschia inconspicua]|uniref:Sulfotransferase family protein n=1 Tax=Nitzschia inconspicua TaxID=303405 RepID=A0A9K3KBP9_9STRA|nr:sulfotransferase family protein [Nitzschia inconspicua]
MGMMLSKARIRWIHGHLTVTSLQLTVIVVAIVSLISSYKEYHVLRFLGFDSDSIKSRGSLSITSPEDERSVVCNGRSYGNVEGRCREPSFTDEVVHTTYEDNDILLIHVGKAGGTSIRKLILTASEQCEDYYSEDDTSEDNPENWEEHVDLAQACAFSVVTTGSKLVHLNRRHEVLHKYDHFLVPLRNPVDRLISWFYYETSFLSDPKPIRQSARLAYLMHCYKDFNSLVTDGLKVSPVNKLYETRKSKVQAQCRQLARQCLTGEYPCYAHNFYNYEWYLERLLLWKGDYVNPKNENGGGLNDFVKLQNGGKDFRIDVLRVEHELDDLNRTLVLWTNGLVSSPYSEESLLNEYTHVRPNGRVSKPKPVEQEGLEMLCRSICPELIVYKKILYHADNLYDHEVQESYDELDERCGINVDKVCGVDFYFRDVYHSKRDRICDPTTPSSLRRHHNILNVGGTKRFC